VAWRPRPRARVLRRGATYDRARQPEVGRDQACWYDPEFNPSPLDLARTYSVAVLPTRPAHPRDKAAAEFGVLVVERWVLAPLRKRSAVVHQTWNAARNGSRPRYVRTEIARGLGHDRAIDRAG
jgi:transposase